MKEFSTSADPTTRTFQVTLAFDPPTDTRVLPGMTAKVTIRAPEELGSGLSLPASSVLADEKRRVLRVGRGPERHDRQPTVHLRGRAGRRPRERDVGPRARRLGGRLRRPPPARRACRSRGQATEADMNFADIALRNRTVTLVLTAVMIFGGLNAFQSLSRLEDPEFTIKDALVITPYPGASAYEVETRGERRDRAGGSAAGPARRIE